MVLALDLPLDVLFRDSVVAQMTARIAMPMPLTTVALQKRRRRSIALIASGEPPPVGR
jgi:hypothetical protein